VDSLDAASGNDISSTHGLVWRSPQLPSSRFCSGCGRTLGQLRHSSRVGCGICYQAFRDVLRAGIRQLQGTLEHSQPCEVVANTCLVAPGSPPAAPPPDWMEQLFGLPVLEWLSDSGPEADVAISSRLRLARNLSRHPFPEAASPEIQRQVLQAVGGTLDAGWTLIGPEQLGPSEAALLRERHLLGGGQALAATPGGRFSLVINEEDHLRLQSLESGLRLSATLPELRSLGRRLEARLDFARSPELGYLTACPSNLGTGLRASVLLHLPALAWFEALPEVLRKVAGVGGLTLRGLHGEESPLDSPFLQLSNQVTLGRAEADLTGAVESVALSLIGSERRARARLLASQRAELEDAVWRAWGLLTHARLLSPQEALQQLGLLRLGYLCRLLPSPAQQPNPVQLLIGCGDAHLEWRQNQNASSSQSESTRADYLRAALG
jgi:protein arginine kinase